MSKIHDWKMRVSHNELLRRGVKLLKEIEAMCENAEAFIVGGAVRDLLMDIPIHDVDIATNVPVSEIAKKFKTHDVGKSKDFNIVIVLYKGLPYEVANFRFDGQYSDARHPDSVQIAETFKEDSSRRDITINALAVNHEGEVSDYHGGVDDIKNGIIQTVGNPRARFTEDPLRIIRTARFAAKLQYEIEAKTRLAMIDLVRDGMLSVPSAERIRDELFKAAATGPSLKRYILILDDVGALELLLPEISAMKSCEHTPETHPEGGVYEHTLAALEVSQSTDPLTNVAILFHDIGKPPTKAYAPNGWVQYKKHEHVGIEIFAHVASRLRFSKNAKAAINFAIKNHMLNHMIRSLKKSKVINLRQCAHWALLRDVARADDASRGDSVFDAAEFDGNMEYVESMYRAFGEGKEFENKMRSFIHGRMIMDVLTKSKIEFKPTDIGRIKAAIREQVIDSNFTISQDSIDKGIINLMVDGH